MYEPKFHSFNGQNTLDSETLQAGKLIYCISEAMVTNTKSKCKMPEGQRLRHVKLEFHCTIKQGIQMKKTHIDATNPTSDNLITIDNTR
jgi:hypothetical protein